MLQYNYGARMGYTLHRTEEYDDWYESQHAKSQVQTEKRLSNIETYEHFGDHKYLENDVWELRWRNGRRVYYAFLIEKNILLLLGGNKNGQNKDIKEAAKILKNNTEDTEA